MRRVVLSVALLCAGFWCVGQSSAFWQSRDSNYNIAVTSGGGSYTGPGDAVSGALAWWGVRAYSSAKAGTKAIKVCDATGANCTDFLTNSSGNLVFQTVNGNNCATSGTCLVTTAYDQSGANSCSSAACDLTQATAGNMPTLTPNCIGSLPCLTGNGTSTIMSNATGYAVSLPFSFTSVAERTGGTTSIGRILSPRGGGTVGIGFGSSVNTSSFYTGVENTATASDSAVHSLHYVAESTVVVDLYVDNADTNITATIANPQFAGAINMFTDSASGQELAGHIMEVGQWGLNFAASAGANATAMCHNQRLYWGTPGSC